MSLDYAILSSRPLPEMNEFFARHADLEVWVDDAGKKGGWALAYSGIALHLSARASWNAEQRARYDALFDGKVAYALHLSGRGSNLDGWQDVEALVETLLEETDGAYVSIDEEEVLSFPRREREMSDAKDRIVADVTAAFAGNVKDFGALIGQVTAEYIPDLREELRRLAEHALESALTSRAASLPEIAEMAALVHDSTLHYSRGVRYAPDWEDPLSIHLSAAHRMLGDDALPSLREFVRQLARTDAESNGRAWAKVNPPSRPDLESLVARGKARDAFAMAALGEWQGALQPFAGFWRDKPIENILVAFDRMEAFIAGLVERTRVNPSDFDAYLALGERLERQGRRAEANVWLALGYWRARKLPGIAKGKLAIAKSINPAAPGLAEARAEIEGD